MKIFKQLFVITGLFALFFSMPVRAFDGAILKGIEIDSPDNQSYRIIIKADKDVPIKKYVTASDKVVVELENIRPAEFVNTVYNNATEIDHVIVQPSAGNKLRIFLQGMNIGAGKIILDTRDEALSFNKNLQQIQQTKQPSEPVAYQQPAVIKEVQPAPVAQEQEKITETQVNNELQKVIQPKVMSDNTPAQEVTDNNSQGKIVIDLSDKQVDKVKTVYPQDSYEKTSENNFQTVQDSLKSDYSEEKESKSSSTSIIDWVLRVLMAVVIMAAAIKSFIKPKKVEINLTSEKIKSREMELLRSAELKKELLTKSIGANTAYKKPVSAAASQYGIREYKNSQLPPSKMAYNQIERPKAPVLTQRQQPQSAVRQPAPASRVTRKDVQQAKENFDGAKFLESMATIYQKSGRDDLASGIRQNILKKHTVY